MKNKKPKFITCNYTNLYGTSFNGRLNREYVYMYSLRGIAECGDNIICYTDTYDYDRVHEYLQAQNIHNVTQIHYPLNSCPYHKKIMSIKNINLSYCTDTSWQNRCVEIMWGKFLWLEDNLTELNDDDYLFWIDAGLSHGGIFPKKFNLFNNIKQYMMHDKDELTVEFSHRHDSVFNKEFSARLEKFAGDKILLITSSIRPHNDPSNLTIHNELGKYPIGGLFGGKKHILKKMIEEFKSLALEVLDDGFLLKEEQIMEVILLEHPELFNTFLFDTWYHEDWTDIYTSEQTSFSKFFEKIISYEL